MTLDHQGDGRPALLSRPLVLSMALVVLGGLLLAGGANLLWLGGSPYYALAGAALLVLGIAVWRRDRRAMTGYAVLLLLTVGWAIAEVGIAPWSLMPRLVAPACLGLWFGMPWVRARLSASAGQQRLMWLASALSFGVLLFAGWWTAFQPLPADAESVSNPTGPADWPTYGGPAQGSHYAPTAQIRPTNVSQLKLAWSYRTGERLLPTDAPHAGEAFELTPLALDGNLYLCTPHNVVMALDGDSGRELWRYDPHVNTGKAVHLVCRGLATTEAAGGTGACARRLLLGTMDNRLLALDRDTGRPCEDFGNHGAVDLRPGMGPEMSGYVYVTSPPAVIGNVAIVGGWVLDNQSTHEPPGVVRAYDVRSGKLLWAWDVLHPLAIAAPGSDVAYPPNTPNMWSIASADPALGLFYLPTGNTPPDFFGGERSAAQDRYSSSVVALDAQTGTVRWSFQTVHHDVWDYDIGAQPALFDFRSGNRSVPALAVGTKRGDIFILDRRTGKPLTRVDERPVPQGGAPGERLSPTQPASTGFPSLVPADLTEQAMWGATPLDQLWCRIQFRKARYDGQFTPSSFKGSLIYPGSFGAIDWGGVAIDPVRRILIANTSVMPYYQRLIARAEADRLGIHPYGDPRAAPPGTSARAAFAQAGTPVAVEAHPFMSPLGFPCNAPPWGRITAIDIDTRRILWQRPLGTTQGVAGLPVALPTGIFNTGGSAVTAGGVTFIAATIDKGLRAFDTRTGALLWETRLPTAGHATPISFVSPRTGRQYVVIAAGGHTHMRTPLGDHVLAYALPGPGQARQ